MAQRIIGLSRRKSFLFDSKGRTVPTITPSVMSRALSAAVVAQGISTFEGEENVQVDLAQRVAFRGEAGSFSSPPAGLGRLHGKLWWRPHPVTGVYLPEGQDLYTSSSSSSSNGHDFLQPSAWFREDVHHHSSMHPY